MMQDFVTIITGVLGAATGGGLIEFLHWRANKRKANAEASQAEGTADATKMDAMGRFVDQLQEQEDKHLDLIKQKDARIEELTERLKTDSNDKVLAQQSMCLHFGCNLRKPERGQGGRWQLEHVQDISLGADYTPVNVLLKEYGRLNKKLSADAEAKEEER